MDQVEAGMLIGILLLFDRRSNKGVGILASMVAMRHYKVNSIVSIIEGMVGFGNFRGLIILMGLVFTNLYIASRNLIVSAVVVFPRMVGILLDI